MAKNLKELSSLIDVLEQLQVPDDTPIKINDSRDGMIYLTDAKIEIMKKDDGYVLVVS